MSFDVIKPGPLSLLQDHGRWGQQQLGISPSGPADAHAFAWACYLLGNTREQACLEITLGPLSLRARSTTHIALTGADLDARIDGEPIKAWCTQQIKAGQTLQLGLARAGLRAYLAVPGGFRAEPCYGSCATSVREKLGGLHGDGQPLRHGDVLEFAPAARPARCVPAAYIPDYRNALTLRLLPGYQFAQFEPAQIERLLSSPYQISAQADRMGYRLKGDALQPSMAGLISEGIAYGAVQVPPSGQPIVLLNDRQTIGGYPKLGCIAAADAAQLAQRRPGESLRFALTDLDTLSDERRRWENFFARGPADNT